MRHESIETEMKYHATMDAEATADAVWEAWGDTMPKTHVNSAE